MASLIEVETDSGYTVVSSIELDIPFSRLNIEVSGTVYAPLFLDDNAAGGYNFANVGESTIRIGSVLLSPTGRTPKGDLGIDFIRPSVRPAPPAARRLPGRLISYWAEGTIALCTSRVVAPPYMDLGLW